ncbi:hypothetical protein ATE84_3444 [Aquimarina sp. MAR_2010_214]|uniref:hypothetical protein n=1 Tax=Aquimarina sp. MAR_2010_214 TaxID=1250026 RepID=UPI000C70EE27|nr:hypothetical protein [Aquimarina sp. MAR_2010_214]PKV51360.1 hypothetical protein ATE84_3444 [Aquimarina sp. MAR_2010_214]
MKTKLYTAVEKLYKIFEKYHLDATKLRAYSCPCCVTDEEIREIVVKPLKQLSEDELRYFSRSAITTFGTVEDYKHFLPRILELMYYSKSDFLLDFTCYEKLNYSEWETWSIEEQSAIEDYFLTLWYTIIHNESASDYQIESVINIILKYGDLDKVLIEWSKSKTLKAILFIIEGVLDGFNFKLSDREYDTITEWLSSETMLSKIENMFFKTKDSVVANRIAIAHTILENKYSLTFC